MGLCAAGPLHGQDIAPKDSTIGPPATPPDSLQKDLREKLADPENGDEDEREATQQENTPEPTLQDLIQEKPDPGDTFQAADTVDYWDTGARLSLQYSMVTLSNWAAGGQNSIALNATGNLFAKYKRDNVSFETLLDMAFALQRLGDQGFRKNEDRFDLNSTFGYKATEKINYAAMLNFRSQFAQGYDYPNDSVVVSRFFSPAFLVLSLGLDYRPNKFFRLNLSPASGKFTIVTNQLLADQGRFGVEAAERDDEGRITTPGRRVRYEFGASLFARFTKEIFKHVTLDLKLDLFNGYADPDPDNRVNIDINSENTINLKVNKLISATLFFQIIYDQDIPVPLYEMQEGARVRVGTGPRTQFRHTSGIGLTMVFD